MDNLLKSLLRNGSVTVSTWNDGLELVRHAKLLGVSSVLEARFGRRLGYRVVLLGNNRKKRENT